MSSDSGPAGKEGNCKNTFVDLQILIGGVNLIPMQYKLGYFLTIAGLIEELAKKYINGQKS